MSSLSHSARLRLLIQLAEPRLNALSDAFWTHPQLSEIFPEYLLTLYASMRTTVPMLHAAADRAGELAETDTVAAQLVPYYVKHAQEELHHDEWLLDDMEVLGIDREQVRRRVAPANIAEMIGAQYYWLHFAHPVSALGCFAVLEGEPPHVETLDTVVARTGIPKEALRTIYKHAHLDPHHRDDLNDVLDSLPLTPEHEAILTTSTLHVVSQLCQVIERIVNMDVSQTVAHAAGARS